MLYNRAYIINIFIVDYHCFSLYNMLKKDIMLNKLYYRPKVSFK